jgi:hypothetical protein
MAQEGNPRATSSVRTVGKVLLALGVVLLLCGAGYAVAYYATNQFFNLGTGFATLADLSYWNFAVAGSGLCLGLVVALIGMILVLVGRRK